MVKFALWIVSLFKRPIGWLGADYLQLRAILEVKITTDFRRKPAMYANSAKKNHNYGFQLWMFALMGFFLCFGLFAFKDFMLKYTIFFGAMMVMLSTTLITEFTSVLFDQRDNHILLPRPVSDRTLLLGRLVHIQFYVGMMALSLSVPAFLVTLVMSGVVASLLFVLAVCCCTWITLVLATGLYLLLSKMVSRSRLMDIINYFQIVLTILLVGGYQLLPRMMEMKGNQMLSMQVHASTFAVPPAWLAGIVHLGVVEGITPSIVLLAVTGVVVALAGGLLMVRFMSRGFGNLLTVADANEEKKSAAPVTVKSATRGKGLKNLLCASPLEQTGWKLAMTISRRDRKFKQAVYPSFGMMLVFAFIAFRPDLNDVMGSLQKLGETQRYFLLIFFGSFATLSLGQVVYTDTPEAGWVYRALPIESPGHLMSGALKAMLVKFYLPSYVLLMLPALFIWGWDVLPILTVACLMTITYSILLMYIQKPGLPFAQPREMMQKGSQFLVLMLAFAAMGVVTGIVYLISLLPVWSSLPVALAVIGANAFLWHLVRKNYGRQVLKPA